MESTFYELLQISIGVFIGEIVFHVLRYYIRRVKK